MVFCGFYFEMKEYLEAPLPSIKEGAYCFTCSSLSSYMQGGGSGVGGGGSENQIMELSEIYHQEINRNAEELITEEEKEKRRLEKRKAKKKVTSVLIVHYLKKCMCIFTIVNPSHKKYRMKCLMLQTLKTIDHLISY